MQFIFDRIVAGVVGLAVISILIGLHFRMQEETVENTNLYSANKQALNFAEILERDLSNAGFGIQPGEQGILVHSTTIFDSLSVTDSLVFRGIGDGGPAMIRYTTFPADSATLKGSTVPTYQVLRHENFGAGWIAAGASPRSLIDFQIELLDLANNMSTPQNARKIRARLVNAVPANDGSPNKKRTLEQVHWGVTLTPSGLALGDFQGG